MFYSDRFLPLFAIETVMSCYSAGSKLQLQLTLILITDQSANYFMYVLYNLKATT